MTFQEFLECVVIKRVTGYAWAKYELSIFIDGERFTYLVNDTELVSMKKAYDALAT